MKVLFFGASFRQGSWNKKLARRAHATASEMGVEAVLREFNDFNAPLYDGDLEAASGVPAGPLALVKALNEVDAVVISTPEYNGSIPGTLKNIVDWTSRVKPVPWEGKKVLLLAASPGALGGVRSLWHSRQPFEVLKAFVYPEMFGLARADKAFDESGAFADPGNQERVKKLLEAFFAARP